MPVLVDDSRTIDTGADGILVPMVNTADEARRIVDICRYAPLGNRGLAPNSARASLYGADSAYVSEANQRLLLAVQIETETALAHVDEILRVEGIDMLFIGPGDLSATMGFLGKPSAPPVVAAIAACRDKIQAAGKLIGTVPRPDIDTAGLFAEGYDLVVDGSDMSLLRSALKAKRAAMPVGRQSHMAPA